MSLSKENKVIIDGQTYYGGLNQPNLKFVKVNVDCWEKIFDFLSLRDILAMSQTCQRMRQIGGHYFRENFHGTTCSLHESSLGPQIFIDYNRMKRIDFLRFVDTLSIAYTLDHLRAVSSMGSLLSSLTTLKLCHIGLNEHQLRGLENIQNNIENIKLVFCSIEDNSVGEFLASFSKLKHLQLVVVKFKSTAAIDSVFQRTYPMLERFEFNGAGSEELIPFLKRNPNIKCLRISDRGLRTIPSDTSKIRLEYLDIDFLWATDAIELQNRLDTLHANGFFKKLRLTIYPSDDFDSEPLIREMTTFNALEVFFTRIPYKNAMDHLIQLKELHMIRLNNETDLETMAMNLNNIERLCLDGTVDQLKSFLRHSKKLKFVIFHDKSLANNALDLFNLNRVREMGGIRQKVQIGVLEKQYLATKWNENGVNCDLVKITRYESIREHFNYQHW